MLLNHFFLALMWIFYGVLHSVLASQRVKKTVQGLAGNYFRHYRLAYTVFAAVSLAGVVFFQLSIETRQVFSSSLFTSLTGGSLAISGLFLMAICIRKYFMSLSGLKSLVQEAPAAGLMITGIHRYLRHPLYLGTFLFLWGLWLLVPTFSLLLANVIITAYTLLAIPLEEKKLVLEFGDQYRRYQKEVPKLWPRFGLAESPRQTGR